MTRRFRKIILPALDIAADGEKIRKMIGLYADRAGLSVGIRDDLPARLIHGALHRFGRCVEIVVAAVEEALLAGADTLTGAHSEMAWGMDEGCPLTANVFAVDDFMALELGDDDEIGDRLERPGRRRAARRTAGRRPDHALGPVLPVLPDESLTSYVRRVAAFHAGIGVFESLAMIELSRLDVIDPSPAALDRIAALTGQPLDVLHRMVLRSIQPRIRAFGDERFHTESANLKQRPSVLSACSRMARPTARLAGCGSAG